MCFLNPNPECNEYLDDEDIKTNPRLRQEVVMLSNAIIATVHMQTMDESFLNKVCMAGKEDNSWVARKDELSRLKNKNEALPKHWEMEDGLLYYKDRLFIPAVRAVVILWTANILRPIAMGWRDAFRETIIEE